MQFAKWSIIILLCVLVFAVIISPATVILLSKEISFVYYEILDFKDLGPIGDYLAGTVGVLISITTLIFLVYNIKLLKDQIAEIQRQQFDSTFFNMMDIMSQIVDEYSRNGESGFSMLLKSIREYLEIRKQPNWLDEVAKQLGYTKEATEKAKKIADAREERRKATIEYNVIQMLTNYVHHIAQMVNIITSNKILNENNKSKYLKILRTRLNIEVAGFLKFCVDDISLFPNERETLKKLLEIGTI